MFPPTRTPVSSLLRRGLDRAVQFATLGEYGVAEEPPASPRARRAGLSAPVPAWAPARAAVEVRPATAAARRRTEPAKTLSVPAPPRRVGEPSKSVPARAALRDLGLRPIGAAAPPRGRQRAGQPQPRPQPCITPLGS